jgi:hypothetical protein
MWHLKPIITFRKQTLHRGILCSPRLFHDYHSICLYFLNILAEYDRIHHLIIDPLVISVSYRLFIQISQHEHPTSNHSNTKN